MSRSDCGDCCFFAALAFPSLDFGPLDFVPFFRDASICFSLRIVYFPASIALRRCAIFRGVETEFPLFCKRKNSFEFCGRVTERSLFRKY